MLIFAKLLSLNEMLGIREDSGEEAREIAESALIVKLNGP